MTSLVPLELSAPLITYDHSPLLRTINQLIERVLIQETANNTANERIGKLEEALEQANNRWNQSQPSTHPSALSSPHQTIHENDNVVVDPSATSQSDDASFASPVNKAASALTSPKRQVDDSRIVDIEKHLADIDAKIAELDEATKQNQAASTPDSDQPSNQSISQSTPAQSNKTIDPRLPALEAKVESLNMAVANLELIDRPKNSQSSPSSALSDQLVNNMVSSALAKQLPEIEKSILSQAAAAANQSINQSISSASANTAQPAPFVKSPSIVATPVNSAVTPSSSGTSGKDDERFQNVESRLSQLENSLSQVKQSSEQSTNQINEAAKKLTDIEQGVTQDRAKWSAQVDVLKQSIGQSLKQSRDIAAELSSRPVTSVTTIETTPISSSTTSPATHSDQPSSSTIANEHNTSLPVDITSLNTQVASLIVGQRALEEDFRHSHDAQQSANRTVNQQIADLNTSMDMISRQLQQLHDRSLSSTSQPIIQTVNQSSPIFTPKARVVNTTSENDSSDSTLSGASSEQAIEVAQGVARQLALLEREFSTLSGRVNSLQTAVQSSTNQSANQSTSLSLLSSALAAQTIAPPAPSADAEAYAHIHYSIKQLRGEQADLASKSMALASQVAALQKRDQSINDVSTDLRASFARVETGLNKQIAQLTTSQKNALDLTARSLKSDILDTERRLSDSMNQSITRTDRDLRAHIAASLEPFALVNETSAGRMPMTVKCFSCGSGAQTVSGPASLKWIQAHGQGSQPTVLPTTHVSEMRIDKGREMYVGGRDGQLYKGRERGSVAMIKGDEDRQQGFNVTYGKLPPVNQPGGGQTARGNLSNRNSLENLPSNQNEEEKEALDTTNSGAGLNQTVSSFVTERE